MTARLPDDCFALPPGVEWTPVDDALGRLRDGLQAVTDVEEIDLADAASRILAAPAIAARANPAHANAAVDGYAFAWDALGGGETGDLPLEPGRAAAGHPFAGSVPPGHALRILTGSEMPAGTDTVVMQEDADVRTGRLRFTPPKGRGSNSRGQGEDTAQGATVLTAGARIGAAEMARLTSVGVGRVQVRRPLRVGILSTGDELLQPGDDPSASGTFDANRPMLRAMFNDFGHSCVDLGAQQDSAQIIRDALNRAAETSDAIVTTGGASQGDEDHISRLLQAEGQVTTWRIAVKPGRPLALGFWNGVPVFGLPGNPVAAFVCALIFVRPALAVLAGQDWQEPTAVTLPAAFQTTKKGGRREYRRARLNENGHVEMFRSEGSGLISGLSWADGLIELPEPAMDVSVGDPVRYLPYSGFGLRR